MTTGIPSRTLYALAAIVAVALVLRLAWWANTDAALPPLSDPQYYHATAQNFAEGRGYSVTLNERGFVAGDDSEATAFWPPGYPFALAPLYALTDSDQRAAKALNIVAGALTVLPVFYVARRLAAKTTSDAAATDDRLGLTAAASFAVAPSLVYWSVTLFTESLFSFGVALTLATALWAGDRRTPLAYFLAGLTLIATSFVRSQGLVLVVPCAVLMLRTLDLREAVRIALPAGAAVALLVVPWAVRNEIAMGRPYPISDNFGYNLRWAHAPYAGNSAVSPQDLWDERPGLSFHDRELFFDDEGRERAIEYAFTHPRREAELAAQRFRYLLQSDAATAVEWSETFGLTPISHGDRNVFVFLGHLYWYPLLVLAIVAPFVVARTRVVWALASLAVAWVPLHIVFAGEPRYHVPLIPVLAILAAATLLHAYDALRADAAATSARDAGTPTGRTSD